MLKISTFLDIIEKWSKKNANRRNRSKIDLDAAQVRDVDNYRFVKHFVRFRIFFNVNMLLILYWFRKCYRIFVATWNVAGKSPTSGLNLEDWLHTSPPADIYVLGLVILTHLFMNSLISVVFYLIQLAKK